MTYGCHNRKDYRPKLMVQDGWWLDGQSRVAKVKQIPFVMSRDCRYTHTWLGQTDERCQGCKHRVDAGTSAGHNPDNPAPQR